MDADDNVQDICRVCRSEAAPDKPLYHPCICTGSIKYIHQECLLQWLKFSKKEYCELCNYRFSFIPIYSPDMPKRLPVGDIVKGLLGNLVTAIRYWIHYTVVAIAWLVIVPLTAYRIFRSLFHGSVASLLTLPFDLISTENITTDEFYGCFIVFCSVCAFIGIAWLREQIIREGPDWLNQPADAQPAVADAPAPPEAAPLVNPEAEEIRRHDSDSDGEDGDDEFEADEVDRVGHENDGRNVLRVRRRQRARENNVDNNNGINNNVNNNNNNGERQVALLDGQEPQEDLNWNPGEWERAAEDLTWERIIGLDGSLIFLEHVFWIISLNTLFIVIFIFCPYHIGLFLLTRFEMAELIQMSRFEGPLTTFCGYLVIGTLLLTFHALMFKFRRTQRLLGLCYLIIKVALLSVFEVGVFPLVCGWWLDICSLPLMGANLTEREVNFKSAPGTSMFIHWLIGLSYIFYSAAFLILLREILRPGILWFLDSINDPDFNPIAEMIHLPIMTHMRTFIATLIAFGLSILLIVWLPVLTIQKLLPEFLPYNVHLTTDSQSSEISVEFLLLQLVVPALLDHNHSRQSFKAILRAVCLLFGHVLDLQHFLFGDDDDFRVHDLNALVRPNGGFEATVRRYVKPKWFYARVAILFILLCCTLYLSGALMLTVPVTVGRWMISLWFGHNKVHEINTVACGLYVGVVLSRCATVLCNWLPRGLDAMLNKLKDAAKIVMKMAAASAILFGMIPTLIGLLFDVVVIIPLRVPEEQTPIYYLGQDWIFGMLYLKVICGVAMMGEWHLREVLDEIYQAGIMNINLKLIVRKLALPVILGLGCILSVPYVIVNGIFALFGMGLGMRTLILRRVYPSLLLSSGLVYIVQWQIVKICRLYEHIKNDKYLVGRRLVNYESRRNANINNNNASGSNNSSNNNNNRILLPAN